MPDVVKFGADATDYFQVVERMKASLAGFSGSVGRAFGGGGGIGDFGDGFLKGERRVSGQAKFLAASLLQAGDAASAAEAAVQAFVLSTRVGLGATVLAVGLFEGFKILHDQIVRTTEAEAALKKSLAIPAPILGNLGPSELGKIFDEQEANLKKFEKEGFSTLQLFADGVQDVKGKLSDKGEDAFFKRQGNDLQYQQQINETARQRGAAELQIVEAKARVVREGSLEAELAKIELETRQKLAALVLKPDQGTPDQIRAVKLWRQVQEEILNKKDAERVKEAQDSDRKDIDQRVQGSVGVQEEIGKTQKLALEATGDKRAAELAGIRFGYEQKIAMLKAKETDDQGKLSDLTEQTIKQLQKQSDLETAMAKEKQSRDVLTGKFNENDPTGLYGDIAKVLKNPQQYNEEQAKENAALLNARDYAQQLWESQQLPEELRPRLDLAQQRIVDALNAADEARRQGEGALDETAGRGPDSLAGKDFAGLLSLASQDFSSLSGLADMDFSGLQGLSGLTITVQ